ncbi:MAG: glutathione S-transferase [Rhodospirillaceae bacterium]|jgi:glutathione S-transferase|nr:glutathione S-transferase [Rhodospirillaceae bacterium]MBT5566078.1 glutathione S-transferase [Rhodospirillaceae bacterium]
MTMKLFYSPTHNFIHKSVVVAEEVGVWGQIEEVPVYPRELGYSIAAINPLAKVPTLALEDGTVLFGSQTVTEYLDSISVNGVRVYPAPGVERWDALTRLSRADLFFDIVTRIIHERLLDHPGEHIVAWHWPKLMRALDEMERDASRVAAFDIGQIGTLQALTFFERQVEIGLPSPAPTHFNWREGHPDLTGWFERAIQRRSVADHFKKPFDGADSPEFCQAKIAEVLGAQSNEQAPDSSALPTPDFVAPASASPGRASQH